MVESAGDGRGTPSPPSIPSPNGWGSSVAGLGTGRLCPPLDEPGGGGGGPGLPLAPIASSYASGRSNGRRPMRSIMSCLDRTSDPIIVEQLFQPSLSFQSKVLSFVYAPG